jgi:hypothetical protein
VVVTVTVTDPQGPGTLQVLPTATARATEGRWRNLDFVAGQTVATLALVPSRGDRVSFVTSVDAHVIVDATGYVTDASASRSSAGLFVPSDPVRLHDSRRTSGPLAPGHTVRVDTARAARTSSGDVAGALLAVTATEAPDGFLRVAPDGGAGAGSGAWSSLNVDRPGQTAGAAVLTAVGTAGGISVFSQNGGHVLVDAAGWFTTGGT